MIIGRLKEWPLHKNTDSYPSSAERLNCFKEGNELISGIVGKQKVVRKKERMTQGRFENKANFNFKWKL